MEFDALSSRSQLSIGLVRAIKLQKSFLANEHCEKGQVITLCFTVIDSHNSKLSQMRCHTLRFHNDNNFFKLHLFSFVKKRNANLLCETLSRLLKKRRQLKCYISTQKENPIILISLYNSN